ncbi:MAG TPA: acyltransferase family protein [Vitreimonas sp.]|nr:acyltransferase family protein [Vitreimonas sp.]
MGTAGGTDALRSGRGLRLDIQGLRAIAVLSVVLYHASADWMPGGFAGVDIFFVISGYLIAGILLAEMERGAYSLSGFYERRVRRLFPALFVMLAAVLTFAAFTLSPGAYQELAKTAFTTIFFASNFTYLGLSNYFDTAAHFRPLLHTWSLAVEEQFYLIFPIVLFVIVKFARPWLRVILCVAAIGSLAGCLWAMQEYQSAAFYLAPFRAYELLIGAVLAGLSFPKRAPAWLRHALSIAGLVLIAGSLVLLNRQAPFPGLAALPPCLGAAAVIFAGANAPSVGGRWISGPIFAYFGALSYSLYLWHWPVFVLARSALLHEPAVWQQLLLIAFAIALATLSWRFVEQPFLKRGHTRRVLLTAAAAMAAGAAGIFPIIHSDGAPARFNRAALQLFAAEDDYSPYRWTCHDFLTNQVRAYEETCVLGAPRSTPHLAVWADSHGVELSAALAGRLAARGQSLLQLTASGCPPSLDYSRFDMPRCAAHNAATLDALENDRRIQTVVVATNYLSYPHKDWPRIFAGQARALSALAAHGKHIVLVYPIPVFDYDVPTALGILRAYGAPLSDFTISRAGFEAEVAEGTAFLDRERDLINAATIHPVELLCDDITCPGYRAEVGVLYFNHDHMSQSAAKFVVAHMPLPDGAPGAAAVRTRTSAEGSSPSADR